MKLEDVITYLRDGAERASEAHDYAYETAQLIGIEAVKRHQEDNKGGFGFISRPLPGETEE